MVKALIVELLRSNGAKIQKQIIKMVVAHKFIVFEMIGYKLEGKGRCLMGKWPFF